MNFFLLLLSTIIILLIMFVDIIFCSSSIFVCFDLFHRFSLMNAIIDFILYFSTVVAIHKDGFGVCSLRPRLLFWITREHY